MNSTPSRHWFDRRGRHRKLIYIRLAFLVPVLIAAFVFHISGSTLVIVRIALVAVLVLAAGWLARHRQRGEATGAGPADRSSNAPDTGAARPDHSADHEAA